MYLTSSEASSPGSGAGRVPAPVFSTTDVSWLSDDAAIFLAGGKMAALARSRSEHPRIRSLAAEITAGCADRKCAADAVWQWVREHVRLVDHSELACRIAGRCDGSTQFIVDPLLVLDLGEGDCAIQTPLVCALLEAADVPCRMIPIAADADSPGRFSHVFAGAILEDGSLYPLDASHGPRPGWRQPAAYRESVWPLFGGAR